MKWKFCNEAKKKIVPKQQTCCDEKEMIDEGENIFRNFFFNGTARRVDKARK